MFSFFCFDFLNNKLNLQQSVVLYNDYSFIKVREIEVRYCFAGYLEITKFSVHVFQSIFSTRLILRLDKTLIISSIV